MAFLQTNTQSNSTLIVAASMAVAFSVDASAQDAITLETIGAVRMGPPPAEVRVVEERVEVRQALGKTVVVRDASYFDRRSGPAAR